MLRRLFRYLFLLTIWLGFAGIVMLGVMMLDMPDVGDPKKQGQDGTVSILDYRGRVLAVYGGPGARYVKLADIPKDLQDAVLATEDRRFYNHFGVDPLGILRAVFRKLTVGGQLQGGSTITQQLAKNLYLSAERSIKRKVQEAVLAVQIEQKLSKREILELYLNRVYFGGGTWGVKAAAEHYFSKEPKDLTLRESALVAGLLKAPTRYNPARNPTAARARLKVVLGAMVDAGKLSKAKADTVLNTPAVPVRRRTDTGLRYATDWALAEARSLIGKRRGSIQVHTTLQSRLQRLAHVAVETTLRANGRRQNVGQAALVAMSPDGAVRAMIGGRDYGESQFNRAVKARRQPASSFKPFVFLAALEAGYRPESRVLDQPVTVDGWQPGNFGNKYLGETTLQTALAKSANAAAVRLSETVGRDNVIDVARRLGFVSDLPDHPSLALGVAEVTPLELAAAYVPFANGGQGVFPYVIRKITGDGGKALYTRQGSGAGQVISLSDAGMMSEMMRAVIQTGSGKLAKIRPDAAGKTGTSQDHRDAWFAGYTSELVAVVWLGNDDGKPMKRVWGSTLPARIWRDFMRDAHHGWKTARLPEDRATARRQRQAVTARQQPERKRETGFWATLRNVLSGAGLEADDPDDVPEHD